MDIHNSFIDAHASIMDIHNQLWIYMIQQWIFIIRGFIRLCLSIVIYYEWDHTLTSNFVIGNGDNTNHCDCSDYCFFKLKAPWVGVTHLDPDFIRLGWGHLDCLDRQWFLGLPRHGGAARDGLQGKLTILVWCMMASWPFVRRISRSQVDSLTNGLHYGALIFLCQPEQADGHAVKLSVIWNALTLLWRHCNARAGPYTRWPPF